jgi:hypothetical protein
MRDIVLVIELQEMEDGVKLPTIKDEMVKKAKNTLVSCSRVITLVSSTQA